MANFEQIKKVNEAKNEKIVAKFDKRIEQIVSMLRKTYPDLEFSEGMGTWGIFGADGVGGKLYEAGEIIASVSDFEDFEDQKESWFVLEGFEMSRRNYKLINELFDIADYKAYKMGG